MSRESSAPSVHWSDRVADEVVADGRGPVISTGISPSGEIHIGNMREVLTADAVFRVLKERGVEARFNYVADNFDPLRRVPRFLDASTFDEHMGRPLCDIPCPCGDHASYAEHFLEPFISDLGRLGIDVEIERSDRMYRSGRMNPWIFLALEKRTEIVRIEQELTGKRHLDDWSPFNPLCPECRRITDARVVGFSRENETIDIECGCGSAATVPAAGAGKLTWRVDWPARWCMLGVTVEPFGKDHATRGGSYDTGSRIVRDVFGGRAPHPIPYEWIGMKGQGDMSSSRGNAISIGQMLEVVPAEALRYFVLRRRPEKALKFDPGVPLLQLVDELDDPQARARDDRSVALSLVGEFTPVGVPFKHLVVIAQATGFDVERTFAVLDRTGYAEADREAVRGRLGYVKHWLDAFAPDDLKFAVQERLPEAVAELTDDERLFLSRLAPALEAGMDGQAVHDAIWSVAKESGFEKPAAAFRAIYLSLLGKSRGPRAGWFIEVVGVEFASERFAEASRSV